MVALSYLLLQLFGEKCDLLDLSLQLLVDVLCVFQLFSVVLLVLFHSFTELPDLRLVRLNLLSQAADLLLSFFQLPDQTLVDFYMLVELLDNLAGFELLCFILVYDGPDVFLHGSKLGLQRRVMLLKEFHGWISIDSLGLTLSSDPLTQ